MSLQKLYVALSRVRQGAHFAVFPARASDLQYLTKLKHCEKLLAWHGNYNADGFWKDGMLVLGSVNTSFHKVDRETGLSSVSKTQLRRICGQLGIYHSGLKRPELCAALQPAFADYLVRFPEQPPQYRKKARRAASSGSARRGTSSAAAGSATSASTAAAPAARSAGGKRTRTRAEKGKGRARGDGELLKRACIQVRRRSSCLRGILRGRPMSR